jgi:hypothetical protein
MNRCLFVLLVCCAAAMGRVRYQVTGNASTCSEVRIPRWTRPAAHANDSRDIDSWGCEYDVRRQANTIYVGLSCGSTGYWRMQEKYVVDLAHPGQIRKIDEAVWEAGPVLEPSNGAGFDQYQTQQKPFEYRGKTFPTSGPKWGGAAPSPAGTRVAVNSWSGTIRDPPDLMEYTGGLREFVIDSIRAHSDGHYWIDIYDAGAYSVWLRFRGSSTSTSQTIFKEKRSGLPAVFTFCLLNPAGCAAY